MKSWINSANVVHKTKFYFFNVTNPKDAQIAYIDLILEEVGPFEVEQRLIYDVEDWDSDRKHLNMRIKKEYDFSALTNREEEITTLNFPLLAIHKQIDEDQSLNRHIKSTIIEQILSKYPLFITRTSKELIEGFKDRLVSDIEEDISRIARVQLKLKLPDPIIEKGRFSLMANVSRFLNLNLKAFK